MTTATPYDLAELNTALQDTLFSGKVHFFAETGSTNTLAI